MPRTWFTSDLHFGHKNIIKYCGRPFLKRSPDVKCEPDSCVMVPDVEAMDEALVENWNRVVTPEDTVWNLGDAGFCIGAQKFWPLISRLNGKHHLVLGNHDALVRNAPQNVLVGTFASVSDGFVEIEVQGQGIVLCHYAMRQWHHAERGVWHLFGHTHGGLRPYGKSVDVGVDNVHEILGTAAAQCRALYRPVSFEEVKAFMDAQPIGPHPMFSGFVSQGGAE